MSAGNGGDPTGGPPPAAAVRVLPCGDAAVLLEVGSLDAVLALHTALAGAPARGVLDLVPAARTVLVTLDPDRTDVPTVRRWALAGAAGVDALAADGRPTGPTGSTTARRGAEDDPPRGGGTGDGGTGDGGTAHLPRLDVPVVYDGADLAWVGERTGLGSGGVVAAHADSRWRVAFCGFAPGFGYLAPIDGPAAAGALAVPRLDAPRERVPAGAVGLAEEMCGVYPTASPGGWRLLGRTTLRLFDPEREPPALLAPGREVRFVATASAVAAGWGDGRDEDVDR